jgi:hypothetical protein
MVDEPGEAESQIVAKIFAQCYVKQNPNHNSARLLLLVVLRYTTYCIYMEGRRFFCSKQRGHYYSTTTRNFAITLIIQTRLDFGLFRTYQPFLYIQLHPSRLHSSV